MELARTRFNTDLIQTLTDYIQQGGSSSGIELSDKEKDTLDKIRFADEKIRESKYSREQVSKFIIGKFDCCRDTAWKHIVMAEQIFSSSYPLNKNAMIAARIEFLQKKIDECIIDKEYSAASNFERSLQKYIEMYKDVAPKRSPKTIIYNIQQNILNTTVTVDQAVEEAETLALELHNKEDY
jgi:hypothetical protein